MFTLNAIAFLSLSILLVAHGRELIVRDNYQRTAPRFILMFMGDPAILLFAAAVLHPVLLESRVGTVALAALIAELIVHLVVYARHFVVRPLSNHGSTIHNLIDSSVLLLVLCLVAPTLEQETVLISLAASLPLGLGLVGWIQRMLGLDGASAPTLITEAQHD